MASALKENQRHNQFEQFAQDDEDSSDVYAPPESQQRQQTGRSKYGGYVPRRPRVKPKGDIGHFKY